MHTVQWIVKPSSFCNLRCSYCYEWDGLGDQRRMRPEIWGRLLRAILRYQEIAETRLGRPVASEVVLHGGEPLALPLDYLQMLMAEKAAVCPTPAVAMQTNLYRASSDTISFLKEHRIALGVSVDVIAGVRRSLSGRETEGAVLRNLDRLRDNEIPFGVITVLARHTRAHLLEIYDFWAARGVPWRVLPLFPGPAARPSLETFDLTNEEIIESLCGLFAHWMDVDPGVRVEPLQTWLSTVLRKVLGLELDAYDRNLFEPVFVVNRDGHLFHVNDEQDASRAMGSLAEHTIDELLAGDARRRSIARSQAILSEKCSACEFRRACNGGPLLQGPHRGAFGNKCPIAYPVYKFIESYLADNNLAAPEILSLLS